MVILRNRLTSVTSGGPRAFAELRDKLIIRADGREEADDLISELDRIDFTTRGIDNAPILVAEPRGQPANVIDRIRQLDEDNPFLRQASDELSNLDGEIMETSRSVARATRQTFNFVRDLGGVRFTEFVRTFADFGPENLRRSPFEMDTVSEENADGVSPNLNDLNQKFDMEEVWEIEDGSEAIVAIFDTGYARNVIDRSRIRDTFHGPDVDSVYEPSEGHGTMCAGAAAANSDEDVPYNGMAPESDVILVRTTDSEGQIRGDYITEAYDWIINLDTDRPIVINHSYGTPLCSGRPKATFCNTAENEMVSIANSTANITSVYAAGNEASTCGRRPFGFTNAITGTNSLADVITVGALRFDGIDAQEYSSHGRGDCAPQADAKPNVTFPLPSYTLYGNGEGWEIKDMSKGFGGSAGGTSHASPSIAGLVALMQSKRFRETGTPAQTEELKSLLHEHAEQPRRTQVNVITGTLRERSYDARFGRGVPQPLDLIEAV